MMVTMVPGYHLPHGVFSSCVQFSPPRGGNEGAICISCGRCSLLCCTLVQVLVQYIRSPCLVRGVDGGWRMMSEYRTSLVQKKNHAMARGRKVQKLT